MTNQFEFLRKVLEAGRKAPMVNYKHTIKIAHEDLQWLDQFLKAPDHELHFKARHTGQYKNREPVYAQDYAVAGEPVDIFSLLTEAMMLNSQFARLVIGAARFYAEHVPTCPICKERHAEPSCETDSWDFSPIKNSDDESTTATSES